MAIDYYPNKTTDDLLVMLSALQNRQAFGGIIATEASGLKQQRSFQGGGSAALELRRVLYSLFLRDPDTYSNPYAGRVRRTRALYTETNSPAFATT